MRPGTTAPTDETQMRALVDEVHQAVFPELSEVSIDLVQLESETDFFQANLDLGTVSEPPLERAYRVLYNPHLFDNPPDQSAVAAILVHELTHILDYTEMNSEQLIEFGIWYATSDTAEYERATDEEALWRGCAEGLIAYREWLYEQLDAEDADEKRRVYFTPSEIREWQTTHGG